MQAKGTFDVKIEPLAERGGIPQSMSLHKRYHGALEASAIGEMLAGGNQKAGSAGYVALETVTGTLDGHSGSFSILQFGLMSAGKLEMRVEVVPGSGVGALGGILGAMKIDFGPQGEHFYTLEYTLPAAP
ncbi:MAG TPA: DUF3224 domain-containing protein [Terracidiphilus sp.]|jgi:hypothetical protein|nr:DUF3224 domain-containing protein [Terracidiphilus sp.]